jgi:hypothetical protein
LETTTFLAGLRLQGIIAPLVFDGPINAQVFDAYVEQFLAADVENRGHRHHGQSVQSQGSENR